MSANSNGTSFRHAGRYWYFAVPLLMMACASTPDVFESRFTQESFLSRDGTFRFRLPVGWINATADAPSPDNLIWLVRSDYGAMLVVRDVVIDEATRHDINVTGLGRVADLLLSLASSEAGASVVTRPAPVAIGRISGCAYEYLAGHPGDHIHAVLVDTGSKVYEVAIRMTGVIREEEREGLISLQEAFIQKVLW